ncbi:purine-binding chemotaxis protein CheW, partial [Candidatus Calescamantes bacterium]|nr:purine-binding chemotaxis protein CheW [Candidatus Calescamantes bacterium]
IQRVIRLPEITRLPQTPDFIKGVINLEGEVVPIIDMHERFGLEKREYDTSTRVIIVKLMEKDVGMIVDSVSQVRVVMNKEIEKVTEVISGISKEYIAGIAKISDSMVILLKIEKILTSKEFTVVSKAGKGKKTKK